MRLASFSIYGLFGTFDHTIMFDSKERIKIVHGPNGFGKTSILRLIDAFFNSRYSVLRRIPYDRMLFSFDDGSRVEVRQASQPPPSGGAARNRQQSNTLDICVTPAAGASRHHLIKPPKLDRERIPLSAIDDLIPDLNRIGPEEWLHLPTGRTLGLGDILEEFRDRLPQFDPMAEPEWLQAVVKSLPVYLIEAQRLLLPTVKERGLPRSMGLPRGAGMSSAVSVYSAEIVRRIREQLAKSAEVSQSLDSSFPKRLLQGSRNGGTDMVEIRKCYDAQVQKRTRLMKAGLLDHEEEFPLPEKQINESEKHVLELYVRDVEEKLAVFDEILQRIELLKDMINRRFQYKQLKIDRNQGFLFGIPRGGSVPPSELSSGEQHEVVLAHQLLFAVPEGALILIDEPELSLHVAWQQSFLMDLEKVSSLIRMDFLVATHSPQIIDGRWDLTAALEGPKQ